MKLFVSPHNDDAVLFGAFTLQREKPLVLTVFDSFVQQRRGHEECSAITRKAEDHEAIRGILGCDIQFAGVPDDAPHGECERRVRWALRKFAPTELWLPAVEADGHEQHNLVGELGGIVYMGVKIHRYLTYTTKGKSTCGENVPWTGTMLRNKLKALACYKTQIEIDALGCSEHFIRDQNEYVVAA